MFFNYLYSHKMMQNITKTEDLMKNFILHMKKTIFLKKVSRKTIVNNFVKSMLIIKIYCNSYTNFLLIFSVGPLRPVTSSILSLQSRLSAGSLTTSGNVQPHHYMTSTLHLLGCLPGGLLPSVMPIITRFSSRS